MTPDNVELLTRLSDAKFEMVVIGGVAAVLHGSPLLTEHLDVCAPLTPENMARFVDVVGPLEPKFRFHPKRPTMPPNPEYLATFRNLNLATTLGDLDVLGEVPHLGGYVEAVAESEPVPIEGRLVQILKLDTLIRVKAAVGRLKDQMGVLHLDSVKKRKQRKPPETP